MNPLYTKWWTSRSKAQLWGGNADARITEKAAIATILADAGEEGDAEQEAFTVSTNQTLFTIIGKRSMIQAA